MLEKTFVSIWVSSGLSMTHGLHMFRNTPSCRVHWRQYPLQNWLRELPLECPPLLPIWVVFSFIAPCISVGDPDLCQRLHLVCKGDTDTCSVPPTEPAIYRGQRCLEIRLHTGPKVGICIQAGHSHLWARLSGHASALAIKGGGPYQSTTLARRACGSSGVERKQCRSCTAMRPACL